MKSIILVALALAAVAVAAPAEKQPEILSEKYERQPDGTYIYKFETEDGVLKEESGVLKEVIDEDNEAQTVLVVRGSYSYLDKDGKPVIIQYVADENGFQPEGDSIPKNPVSRR